MNATTCGGGMCRKQASCRDHHCEGHPRNTGDWPLQISLDETDDERARALNRFHAITEAEDEPPTRAEAVAWLFGELVAAVVCIGFVAGLVNLIWVNRHWLKSVISSYFS